MEEIMTEERVELEFSFSTSPNILFYRLSNPLGLAEWFADEVFLDEGVFVFRWEKIEHRAELVSKKDNHHIRFHWLQRDTPTHPDNYLEFRIIPHDLTRELVLHVTEQHPGDNLTDVESLWEYQIGELKRNLGV